MTNAIINVQKKKRRNVWCCRRQKFANAFKDIRPILRIMKFVGAFPCRTTDRGVKLGGPFEYAWFAMFLALHIVPLVILEPSLILELWGSILGFCFIIKEYLYLFAMTWDNYNCLRNRMTVSFFENLAKFDEKARRLGHPREHGVAACWVLTAINLTCNFLVSTYGLYMHCVSNEADDTCAWFVSRVLLELAHSNLTLKWIVLVYLMYQRFRHFNNIVRSNLLFSPVYSTGRPMITRDIVALHRNLVENADIFNHLTSFNFFIIFAADFAGTLMHLKSLSNGMAFFVIKLLVLFGFAQTTVLCYVCDMATCEANEAARHFTDCPTTLNYSTAIEERVNLMMHFMHNKIVFNAADVFAVNLRTFFGMVLSLFSFTVILWSFD